jgi:hypothetical protein
MTAIRQYSSEPGFTSAVDKWSFAIDQNSWNNASSGVSGDFGLIVFSCRFSGFKGCSC